MLQPVFTIKYDQERFFELLNEIITDYINAVTNVSDALNCIINIEI